MTHPRGVPAIQRILGVDVGADAIDMLGLTPTTCVPARIEAALERQLERVDQHPLADTPEADDVRLALHTAAAQLLDPEVRRTLIERAVLQPEELSLPGAVGVQTAPERRAAPAAPVYVAAEVPTQASVQQVPVVASVRVEREPSPVEPSRRVRPEPVPSGRSEDFRREHGVVRTQEEPGGSGKVMITLGALGVVCVLLLGGLIIAGSRGRTQVMPAPAASTPSTDGATPPNTVVVQTGPPSASAQPVRDPGPEREFTDPAVIVRELQAAVVTARADPIAGFKAFEDAVPGFADWWPRFERSQRIAAETAVVDLMYVLGESSDVGPSLHAALMDRSAPLMAGAGQTEVTARQVWSAPWAAGVLVRLGSQAELGRGQAAKVSARLIELFGPGYGAIGSGFEDGARASLLKMIVPLCASEASASEATASDRAIKLKRWADAVASVSASAPALDRSLAEALERVLIDGPEPSSDIAAAETIEFLASRIKWRADGQARERLIAWFGDGRVSDDDLAAVTRAVATRSGAENIQPDMVLSAQAATSDDRARLRSRYATAWGLLKAEVVQTAIAGWAGAFLPMDVEQNRDSEPAKIAHLVQLARLNDAARRIHLGDPALANAILTSIPSVHQAVLDAASRQPGPTAQPPTAPPPAPLGPNRFPVRGRVPVEPTQLTGNDGDWTLAYMRAEHSIPARLERLSLLSAWTGSIGPIDAGTLMDAACFGSPVQVRMAAQAQVVRFADDPAVINAALSALPAAPKIWSVSEMFATITRSRLPKVGDPDWELAARRALVERLLSMVATGGDSASIEMGERLLSESYKRMAGASSGNPGESDTDLLLRSATALYMMLRVEADRLPPASRPPFTLEQIQRRRDGRIGIASGPLQAFAAEQAAVAEMLAYVVCAELPVEQGPAGEIMARCSDERRRAGHVLDQLSATELGIARLWRLRLRAMDGGSALGEPGSAVFTPVPTGGGIEQ